MIGVVSPIETTSLPHKCRDKVCVHPTLSRPRYDVVGLSIKEELDLFIH